MNGTSKMIEDCCYYLRLTIVNRMEYHSDLFRIKLFRSNVNSFSSSSDMARVFDIETGARLDSYQYLPTNFQKLVTPDRSEDYFMVDRFLDDRFVCVLLLEIVANTAKFLERKIELKRFADAEHKLSFTLSSEQLKSFEISKCKVYRFCHQSEERTYRVGKDDHFDVTEITRWLILYDGVLISNTYLDSLLPVEIINEYRGTAYAATYIGEESKIFKQDEKETGKLQQIINMEELLASI